MNNVVDLNKEREIKTLIDKLGKLISVKQETIERTIDYLNEVNTMDTEKTRTVSVRFPIELLDWIDSYSRIAAVNQESRVTRNMVVINFLELMRATMQRLEQSDWGCSHQTMIQKAIDDATTTSNDNAGTE